MAGFGQQPGRRRPGPHRHGSALALRGQAGAAVARGAHGEGGELGSGALDGEDPRGLWRFWVNKSWTNKSMMIIHIYSNLWKKYLGCIIDHG
jgi:hypothetical protein